MCRCLQLARMGEGYTAPNPMVGALLVCDGKIVGEGYHEKYGHAHAEPNAIHSVKDPELLKKSTLYVTLEPCSHYGKTPPCANLIVRSGIPRVVIGTLDPNPKVSGNGVRILREAGVDVVVGILKNDCHELNKRFFIYQNEKRPFVLLKWAQTKDGFIDKIRLDQTEQPLLISNEITRQLTHKTRAENQAILVSTNTVILDNPSLTVRNWSGRNPVRVIIDRQGRIPKYYRIFNAEAKTLVFTEKESAESENVEFIHVVFDDQCLESILKCLYERNINSLLVEGGASILKSFIDAGLWDEANIEVSGQTIGNSGVKAPEISLQLTDIKMFNQHQWIHLRNNHKKFRST